MTIPGEIEPGDTVQAVIVHDGVSSVVETKVLSINPSHPYPYEVFDGLSVPAHSYRCCRGDLSLIRKASRR